MGGVFKGPLRQYSQFLAANIITFGRALKYSLEVKILSVKQAAEQLNVYHIKQN